MKLNFLEKMIGKETVDNAIAEINNIRDEWDKRHKLHFQHNEKIMIDLKTIAEILSHILKEIDNIKKEIKNIKKNKK